MVKKMVFLLVVLSLAVTLAFSGCDSGLTGVTPAGTTAQSDTGKESVTEPKQEFVNLIWYQVGDEPKNMDAVMKKVNEYLLEKLNANITIYYLGRSGLYAEKMVTTLNSGEYLDICFTANYAAHYFDYAPRGAFRELNDLLPVYGKDLLDLIEPAFWKANEIKGKNYAVPVIKDMAQLAVLNVNVPIAKKYGIDIPRLADINYVSEALEIVSKEIETNKGFVPLIDYPVGGPAGQTALPHQTIVWPFGIRFDTTNPGKVSTEVLNLLKTPELKELLDIVREWNEKGYYNRDLMAKDETKDYLKDGDFFLTWYGYFPYYEYTHAQVYGYEFQVVPMGKQLATTQSQTGAMHAISIVSKHPERSMMFLNLLNTDRYLRNLLAYGIDGVHYDLVNNKVSYGDRTPEQRYEPNRVMQGNNLLLNLLESDPDDKWEFFDNFNRSAVSSPLLGFFPDLKPVENELAVINNVVEEYQDYLWNGTLDPEVYLPEYIQKVDDAGAEKVRLEIQRQVDNWLKSR